MVKKQKVDPRAYAKVKVYTKTGDKGETSLFGGKRVPKFSLRVEAYGMVDELNSAIGVAIAEVKSSKLKVKNELEKIQSDLLDIGSALAIPFYSSSERRESRRDSGQARMTNSSRQVYAEPAERARTISNLGKRTEELEKLIDWLTAKIPELANFILPGGGKVGSHLHLCRTICRRAERRIVELAQKEKIAPEILEYFNRLSDLLFTMARFVNHKEKKKETIWMSYH